MNYFKIWFDKNGSRPLGGIVNELRLIRHKRRFKNSNSQLTLISNYNMWDSKENQQKVINFCNYYDINLVSLAEIENMLLAESNLADIGVQLSLLKIAKQEIIHKYGNLAAASDIVRALSPCLDNFGAYSDLDVEILNDDKLNIEKHPMLLSLTGCKIEQDSNDQKIYLSYPSASNNFIYSAPNNHLSKDFFIIYRSLMLKAYTTPCVFSERPLYTVDKTENLDKELQLLSQHEKNIFHQPGNYTVDIELLTFNIRKYIKENFKDEQKKENLLMLQIIAATGPIVTTYALAQFICKKITSISEIEKGTYFLESITLENSNITLIDNSDISWGKTGLKKLITQEQQIKSAAKTCLQAFLTMQKLKI